MAARTQVTGPILHFVGFPGDESSPQFWFLGTSRQTPKIRVDRSYLPIMFENGGYTLPMDLAYQGKQAKIITQLNLFDPQIYYGLSCSPRYTRTNLALGRGLDSFRDNGSLMLGNKGYFSLYLMFPFSGTVNSPTDAAYFPSSGVNFSMPKIYRFPACMIEYDDQVGGSDAQELTLAIHAQRIYYPRGKYKNVFGSTLAGGFFLYDNRNDYSAILDSVVESSLKYNGALESSLRSLIRTN